MCLRPEHWTLENMPRSVGGIKSRLRHPKCPSEILWSYAIKGYAFDIVSNPNCPSELLEALANHQDCRVNRKILEHPNATPAVLQKLSFCPDSYFRSLVRKRYPHFFKGREIAGYACYELSSADVPSEQLVQLFHNTRSISTRSYLLANPRFSFETIQSVIAAGCDTFVGMGYFNALILNPSVTPGMLALMYQKVITSSHRTSFFFSRLVTHPNCPIDVLLALSMHPEHEVRSQAIKRLHELDELLPKGA